MAIFHLDHRFIQRSKGQSVLAKAAYNAGQRLEKDDGRTGYYDDSDKEGVLFSEITEPGHSPGWSRDRGELWRRLENREDRSTRPATAQLAHDFVISLPHELTLEQNIFLMRDFVRNQFVRDGYVSDWAIHAGDPRGDQRNIHAHVLVPLRKIQGDDFGIKDRTSKEQLRSKTFGWRKGWAESANHYLYRFGQKARIDERSFKAQGIDRKPKQYDPKRLRPRSNRLYLMKLRGRQPPLPKAPVVQIETEKRPGGQIFVRAQISHSALGNLGRVQTKIPKADAAGFKPASSRGPQALRFHSTEYGLVQGALPVPRTNGRSGGWPAAAMADWRAWGHREPKAFFDKWPDLKTSNLYGGLQHD